MTEWVWASIIPALIVLVAQRIAYARGRRAGLREALSIAQDKAREYPIRSAWDVVFALHDATLHPERRA